MICTIYCADIPDRETRSRPYVPPKREAALREQRSFAVEDLVVDTELLESARDVGYATKVVFISTEALI